MTTFFWYVRLYFLIASRYVQARMRYRADFVISTIGMLAGNAATLAALWVVFTSVPTLAGYTYPQIVFLYAFSLLAQAPLQILFDHIWWLRYHANQGTFVKYYFKPLPTLFYYLSEVVDLKGFALLAFGIGAFAWASVQLGVEWTPLRIVLLPLLLGGGGLVLASLLLIAASITFWVKDSFAILAFVNGFRDHARYPMGIYNSFFQVLFTWIVPIGFIAFYPAQVFLFDTPPSPMVWATPFVGLGLFGLAVLVWNRGVRRWGGTGS